MKRKLIFLISTLLICGSIFAQNHYTFNTHDYQLNMGVVAQIKINGIEQTSSNLELGAFKGESIRGSHRIYQYGSAGYYRVYIQIYGDPIETGYEIAFKLYNHETGEELDNCNITYLEEPLTVTWSAPNAIGTNRKPVVIDFTTTSSQTLTKEITGYGNGNGNWYLIASPFADDATPTTVGMITNDEGEGENVTHTFDLYWFDQSEHLEWRNYRQVTFDLVNGKGYLYANKNDVTLTFTGTPIEGTTKEVPLVKDDNAEFPGWNLVGNPFTTSATLDLPYYRLNQGCSALNTYTENTEINAMEGVFIQATDQTPSATFTKVSTESKRVSQLNIKVTRNRSAVIDNAIIRFDNGATLGKFQLNPSSTKVYFTQGSQDFAVVRSANESEMPISFKAEENGTYTLSFDAQGVSFDYLHLIDNMTGNDVDLLAGASTGSATYTFEAKTTDYASRFKLVFATICEDADSDNDFAFFSNGKLVILNEGLATFQVVDLMGRIIKSETINGSANINVDVAPGVYMLHLMNGYDIKTQKIVME